MQIKDINITRGSWKIKGTDFGIVWINGTQFREVPLDEKLDAFYPDVVAMQKEIEQEKRLRKFWKGLAFDTQALLNEMEEKAEQLQGMIGQLHHMVDSSLGQRDKKNEQRTR